MTLAVELRIDEPQLRIAESDAVTALRTIAGKPVVAARARLRFGVNIVDLGFVRAVLVQGQTAVITMTLTSAACPLTGIMENQMRSGLARLDCIEGFRVDWQWIPAWRPADITDSGREQLRAIGFTI